MHGYVLLRVAGPSRACVGLVRAFPHRSNRLAGSLVAPLGLVSLSRSAPMASFPPPPQATRCTIANIHKKGFAFAQTGVSRA